MSNKKYIFSILLSLLVLCASAQEKNTNAKSDLFSNFSKEQINIIEIYPNPSVKYIIADIKNSELNHIEIEIRSIIGNEVNVAKENIGSDKYRFNVESLASGYYFLIVKDESTQFKKAYKFLKK